ncbi:MAG: CsbD family protein [Methylococcales bacterium]
MSLRLPGTKKHHFAHAPFPCFSAVEGRVQEGKGKIKEVTGKVIGDKKMEVEGNVQKNVGKVQKGVGDINQDIKEDK